MLALASCAMTVLGALASKRRQTGQCVVHEHEHGEPVTAGQLARDGVESGKGRVRGSAWCAVV